MKNILPKLVVFSPLPPSKTGIADYVVELSVALSLKWNIHYVIGDNDNEPSVVPANGSWSRVSEFKKDKTLIDAPRLYQMGNNLHHEYIMDELLKVPGIVVLHDYSMHHLQVERTLARGDVDGYRFLMEHDYGDLGKRIADSRINFVFNHLLEFVMPLNGTLIKSSKSIIVHSNQSLLDLKFGYPDKDSRRIPFPFTPELEGCGLGSREHARDRLRLSKNKLILCSLGFITPPKQVEFAIEALASIKESVPDFEYWLVGEKSEAVDLDSLIKKHGLEDNIKLTGFVTLEEFHHYIEAADIVISLRYPSAGETSAALYRAMGMRRCNVVFDYSSYCDLPDHTLVKIPLNTNDTSRMSEALETLMKDPKGRDHIGEQAFQYVLKEHNVCITAEGYDKCIRENYGLD